MGKPSSHKTTGKLHWWKASVQAYTLYKWFPPCHVCIGVELKPLGNCWLFRSTSSCNKAALCCKVFTWVFSDVMVSSSSCRMNHYSLSNLWVNLLSHPVVEISKNWEWIYNWNLGHVHTRASDPGPELMWVGPGSEVLFTLAQRNSSGFNPPSVNWHITPGS